MPRKSIVALVLTLLTLTVVVGCGGGGGNEQAAATTEAPATTQEAITTEAAGTTVEETVTAETSTSDLSVLASTENCRELADLGQKFSSAFQGAADSKNLKKQADLLAEFAEKTPSSIRADFRVFADYLKKIADALGDFKAGSRPNAETLAKLQKLSTEIDQAKVTKATQNISAWLRKNCTG
jgi:hypothetical protein